MPSIETNWMKATIGGLSAVLLLFLSLFVGQVYATAAQVQESMSRIAVLEKSIENQEKLLGAILQELKEIRNDQRAARQDSR